MNVKKPSADDMYTAAEWLGVYDEECESFEAIAKVREWLLEYARNEEIRIACKKAGVSVTAVRKELKKNKK